MTRPTARRAAAVLTSPPVARRARLGRRGLRDPVTGLAGRALFEERLALALTAHRSEGRTPALILLDLDAFRSVNDGFGHDVGDAVLVQVGRRLRACTPAGDLVARLGGDEFAVVLGDGGLGRAATVAGHIEAALRDPITVEGHDFRASASAGIVAACPGDDPGALLRNADIAMYAAKENCRGSSEVYDPDRHQVVVERHRLDSDLRGAAGRGELVLHYQPIFHLRTGAVHGLEALVRWQHPERGLVPPDDFIPLAESSGTIREIGAWVLEAACRQLARWESGPQALHMSVNLSPRELQDGDLVARVADVLVRVGTDPARITLEVTETALMHNTEAVIETLYDLKRLGVTLAIDDFGTGYSSLSYLRRLPVDVVKIDRAFVAGIARAREEWALTAAIVRLANSLGKRTLAEGIELGEQLAHLRALDCELGQGYLFARPMPAAELESFLARNGASPKGDPVRSCGGGGI
ncbi:MAG: EAL domain-containing protein [Actinobacteria bacterium]|nr:EAL domain-containing protein [Actinomycetota bacterium]